MKLPWILSLISSSLFAQTVTPPSPLAESFVEITGDQSETVLNPGVLTFPNPSVASPDLRSRSAGAHQSSPISTGQATYPYAATRPAIAPFYNQFPNGEATTTVQPTAPPDVRMIFLDGAGSSSMVAIDLTNPGVIGHVTVPSVAGPFGIRPSATGPANEVWTANGGLEVSVVDFGSQTLLANILTPSIPQAVAPTGIVFTNGGATALEAVSYYSPDSAGNNGALLVFNAVSRTVTSTLLLKNAPGAIVIAPDGLTAYIMTSAGVTYYDVLSGTADLTASTYTSGLGGGYGGGPVFIHPDGTRLFWNTNYILNVFDLTTRRVTNLFNSGLPSTAGSAMTVSQDGARAYF
jgi:hypothetical protein